MKIIRVERNKTFWNEHMFNKLKHFYCFYMIPRILYPETKLSFSERKWVTDKELSFLSNGLVDSIEYYKEISHNRGYVVTHHLDVDSIKEILIDDYLTLSPRQWLSDFVVDHCLGILNSNHGGKFQIISVSKSSHIFS